MKIDDFELRKLTVAMAQKNLSISQVIELIKNSNVQGEKLVVSDIKYVVDYTKTVEQAIYGYYDHIDSDVTAKNFPTPSEMLGKTEERSVRLFYFNREMSADDVIIRMKKEGYRPAILIELLFLGISFPGLQTQFPIYALGSIWRKPIGSACIPGLRFAGYKRVVCLDYLYSVCKVHFRFLGIKE